VVQDGHDALSRQEALAILGVESTATEAEIMRAYKAMSAPLKRSLTSAVTVEDKDRFRALLRRCVRARDAALNRERRAEPQPAIALDAILGPLSGLSFQGLARVDALLAMGLGPDATDDQVRTAFTDRYRILTRHLSSSADAQVMRELQDARYKMRRLRAELLADDAADVRTEVPVADDSGDTDEVIVEADAAASAAQPRKTVEDAPPRPKKAAPDRKSAAASVARTDGGTEADGGAKIDEDAPADKVERQEIVEVGSYSDDPSSSSGLESDVTLTDDIDTLFGPDGAVRLTRSEVPTGAPEPDVDASESKIVTKPEAVPAPEAKSDVAPPPKPDTAPRPKSDSEARRRAFGGSTKGERFDEEGSCSDSDSLTEGLEFLPPGSTPVHRVKATQEDDGHPGESEHGKTADQVTAEYRQALQPLRADLLMAVTESDQVEKLRAVRELRARRDAALREIAGPKPFAGDEDELLDMDTDEFDKLVGS